VTASPAAPAPAPPDLLISPTEPEAIRALGTVSPEPEAQGADVLWEGPTGRVGVQRKELADLVTSLHDGRLGRELRAMRWLATRVLLIEGRVRWTVAGLLATVAARVSKEELRGLLLSVQLRGVWVLQADDVADSARAIRHLHRWSAKRDHRALDVDARARGQPATRSWGTHVLQAVPGVGPVVAGAIWDHFGGLPLRWSCTPDELGAVRGVGPTRASTLMTLFGPVRSTQRVTQRATQREEVVDASGRS
jgi:ERCC4-type nuclease